MARNKEAGSFSFYARNAISLVVIVALFAAFWFLTPGDPVDRESAGAPPLPPEYPNG